MSTSRGGRQNMRYATVAQVTFFLAQVFLMIVPRLQALPVGNDIDAILVNLSGWSNCSRSCDSGVSVQTGTCVGGNCDGEVVKQYRSCCIEDCPQDTPDFREKQCKEQGKTRDASIDWIPSAESSDKCQLVCVSRGEDSTSFFIDGVEHGTPCTTSIGVQGVCLGRLCAPVGCDNILGSLKLFDKCHRCVSPDDASCVEHSDIYISNSPVTIGNLMVLEIPSGATSITIKHSLKDNHGYLALKSESGAYYFDGRGDNGSIHSAAGADFHYTLESKGDYFTETLTSTDILSSVLIVELRDVTNSIPEVTYTYHLPREEAETTHNPEDHNPNDLEPSIPVEDDDTAYMWKYGPFSECSVSCATGLKTAHAQCSDDQYPDRILPDNICLDRDQPKPLPIQQKCNTVACPPRWVKGEWTTCSRMCAGGRQRRLVECRQLVEPGKDNPLDESACVSDEPKPDDVRECNTEPCPYTWSMGEWSQCSKPCGGGKQTRRVVCVETATNTEANASNCAHLLKPDEEATCQEQPCLCEWRAKQWRKCNNSCGYGFQSRKFLCHYATGNRSRADKSCCDGQTKPEAMRPCADDRRKSCQPDWQQIECGQCNGNCSCTSGSQVRHCRVLCMAEHKQELVTLPDEFCNASTKPPSTKPCQRTDCPYWTFGDYGPCSTSCGAGYKERSATCVNHDGVTVSNNQCCGRPETFVTCENDGCSTTTPEPTLISTDSECIDQFPNCGKEPYNTLEGCRPGQTYATFCCASCAKLRSQASSAVVGES